VEKLHGVSAAVVKVCVFVPKAVKGGLYRGGQDENYELTEAGRCTVRQMP